MGSNILTLKLAGRCMAAAAIIAFLWPAQSQAQRKLIEDDNQQNQAGKPSPVEDDQARKLAKDLIDSIAQAYSKVSRMNIKGFTAVYNLSKEGQPAGTVKMVLDNAKEDFQVTIEGAETGNNWLKKELDSAMLTTIAGGFKKNLASARKEGDGFVLEYAMPADKIKSCRYTIGKDYRILKESIQFADGATTTTEYQTQTVEGKNYISDIAAKIVDGTAVWETKIELTYKKQEGLAFIKKFDVILAQTAPDDKISKTKYLLELASLDLQKETSPGVLGKEAAFWDDLTKEIIPKIMESNPGFETLILYVKSLSCKIDVSVALAGANPQRGTISYAWEDKDANGILAGDEIKVETTYASSDPTRLFLKQICIELVNQTAGLGSTMFSGNTIQTVKTDDGYRMKLNPLEKAKKKKAGEKDDDNTQANIYDEAYLTISKDFRLMRVKTIATDKQLEVVIDFDYQKVGDFVIATKVDKTVTAGGKAIIAETRKMTYEVVKGLPLLQKLVIDTSNMTTAGSIGIKQEYVFKDIKAEPRDKPLRNLGFGDDDAKLFPANKTPAPPGGQQVPAPADK